MVKLQTQFNLKLTLLKFCSTCKLLFTAHLITSPSPTSNFSTGKINQSNLRQITQQLPTITTNKGFNSIIRSKSFGQLWLNPQQQYPFLYWKLLDTYGGNCFVYIFILLKYIFEFEVQKIYWDFFCWSVELRVFHIF